MIISQLLLVILVASIVGFFLGMIVAMFDLEEYVPFDLGYDLMPRAATTGFISAAALTVWAFICVIFGVPFVMSW